MLAEFRRGGLRGSIDFTRHIADFPNGRHAAIGIAQEGKPSLRIPGLKDLAHTRFDLGLALIVKLQRDQLFTVEPSAQGRPELRLQSAYRDPGSIPALVNVIASVPAAQSFAAGNRIAARLRKGG